MVVTSHAFASSRTWSPPSGMTESFDRPNGANNATGLSIEGNRVLQAVAGATGVKTATAAGFADAGNAHILALRPAGVNLSISKPTGTVAGDVMIAAIGFNNSTAAIAPPVGWTLVRRLNNGSTTSNSLAVFRRTAAAGEPASYAWAIAGGAFLVGGIHAFSGVDTANPIDTENGQVTPSGTGHVTPSITTTSANAMLVTAHTYASANTWSSVVLTETFDRPSGTNSNTGQSVTGGYQLQAAAGASGTKLATAGGNADVGNTHILALRRFVAPVAQLYFIEVDHLNTPRLVENASQQAVWKWDQQEPFGANIADENPSGLGSFTFNLRLPGQYFDKETNLHYNYYRDYDPSIGRYVQSDPIGIEGGLNTYSYVHGSPLRFSDAKGLFVTSVQAACTIDPMFCAEIMGEMLQNTSFFTQGCISEEARLAAEALDDIGRLATVISIASAIKMVGSAITKALNPNQLANLKRFQGSLPKAASPVQVFPLPNGGKAFQANVPARNIPGSFAQYEKQVDAAGNTLQYTITTFGPDGTVVRVKNKISGAQIP